MRTSLFWSVFLLRLDRGAEWKVGQWISQTQKDEQEEHRWGSQSTSANVKKQWQVRPSTPFNRPFGLRFVNDLCVCVCVQQANVRIFWSRLWHPAALSVQSGGRAGEGGAAGGVSTPHKCVHTPNVLRRRCPGLKVKTISLCTSWLIHSCTVILAFLALLQVGLFLLYLNLMDMPASPCSSDRMSAVGVQRNVFCAWVCAFASSPVNLCADCLCCPVANDPKRRWADVESATAFREPLDPKPQSECKSVSQETTETCASTTTCEVAQCVSLVIIYSPSPNVVRYVYVYMQPHPEAGVQACRACEAYL